MKRDLIRSRKRIMQSKRLHVRHVLLRHVLVTHKIVVNVGIIMDIRIAIKKDVQIKLIREEFVKGIKSLQ